MHEGAPSVLLHTRDFVPNRASPRRSRWGRRSGAWDMFPLFQQNSWSFCSKAWLRKQKVANYQVLCSIVEIYAFFFWYFCVPCTETGTGYITIPLSPAEGPLAQRLRYNLAPHRNKHGETLNAWNPLFNGFSRLGKWSTFERPKNLRA